MIRYIENFKVHYKTELCRNFMETGYCEFDDDCAYAHGIEELKGRTLNHNNNRNYKTKLCKRWHELTPGQCTYGSKCQFIHDEKDHEKKVEQKYEKVDKCEETELKMTYKEFKPTFANGPATQEWRPGKNYFDFLKMK